MSGDLIFLAFVAATVMLGLVLRWIERRRDARADLQRRLDDIGGSQ